MVVHGFLMIAAPDATLWSIFGKPIDGRLHCRSELFRKRGLTVFEEATECKSGMSRGTLRKKLKQYELE